MTRRHLTIAVLMLALACSARAREYDAEADVGLVAEKSAPEVAARNTELLTAALNAQWSGGKFEFADGHVGPVLLPIRAAAKEFFFAGTILSSNRIGGSLFGSGGRSFPMNSGHYNAGGTLGGAVTRFTRIDGDKVDEGRGGAVIRLRGTGFVVDGIEFRGQPYLTDSTGEGPLTGTKTPVGIEIEGRTAPATGEHVIRNCTIAECGYGVCARAGYYDAARSTGGESGKFVKEENHADNSIIDGVHFWNCDSCFRTENVQAMVWKLRDIQVGGWGGRGLAPTIVCDIVRGGNVTVDGLSLNHFRSTVFRVTDYSHNNQCLTCNGLKWDGGYGGKTAYITLFEYAGPVYAGGDMSAFKWTVRMTGHVPSNNPPTYDASKLIVIPDGAARISIPRNDLLFDVARLPLENFTPAGGPWYRPK